jgi:5-formyltetrahydrofolate cyclo-ligase
MTKEELRKTYLQKRISLTDLQYEELNISLCKIFFDSVLLSSVTILHAFLPLRKYKEPDTWLIINRIKNDFPHIRITLPKVNEHTQQIENYFFEGIDQLEINKWGIPEPKTGTFTSPMDIDIVLVPLLAFDRSGNRVGYGKGFYDKLLPLCKPTCHRIGLSLFPPVENEIPTNSHDQRLTHAITPNGIFDFR